MGRKKRRGEWALTRGEWNDLGWLFDAYMPFLAKSVMQVSMLMLVKRKTLWFGNYEANLSTKELLRGVPKFNYPGCTAVERAHVFRLRKDLEDRAVVWYGRTRRASEVTVRLNLWGIIQLALQAMERAKQREETRVGRAEWEDALESLRALEAKVTEHWKKDHHVLRFITVVEEKKMLLMKEAEQEGREKNEAARERRRERRAKQKLKTVWVKEFLRERCEEAGIRFNDEWTGRTFGNVRNFLNTCHDAGKEPRTILRDAVAGWERLADVGLIIDGKPVKFLRAFDFDQFYRWRAEVMNWLREGRHRGAGWKVVVKDVVDLRGKKND